jgi:hypothetical protein
VSGFIDLNGPTNARIERLEALISEALPLLGIEAFSPEAQAILADLMGENEVRRERARRVMQRAMEADPLPAEPFPRDRP